MCQPLMEEIQEGVHPCHGRGCTSTDTEMRFDAYGIETGYYCDKCYDNNYPYRRDRYFDPDYAGERLEEDY